MRWAGADYPVGAMNRGNARGAKGMDYPRHDWGGNWQQEEPRGHDGKRQLSRGGTSRVTGDSHARICERLGVKFPGPTRPAPLKSVTIVGRNFNCPSKNGLLSKHNSLDFR